MNLLLGAFDAKIGLERRFDGILEPEGVLAALRRADHIIAVASDQSLGELTALLRSLDGKPAPRPAVEAVIAAIRQGRRQLGLQGLYTAP